MSNDFVSWLEQELQKRGWRQAELVRRSGLSRAVISKIMTGMTRPSPETLLAIARALGIAPEIVFRRAGLLPPRTADEEDIEQAMYLLASMSPEARREALAFLQFKAEMERMSGSKPPPGREIFKRKESREDPALGG